MRAIESGRYLVRAANTGISGIVDPYGRVLERTPIFQPAVLARLPVRHMNQRQIPAPDALGDLLCVDLVGLWTVGEQPIPKWVADDDPIGELDVVGHCGTLRIDPVLVGLLCDVAEGRQRVVDRGGAGGHGRPPRRRPGAHGLRRALRLGRSARGHGRLRREARRRVHRDVSARGRAIAP
mgnify:CR=1 FL=1